MDILVAGLGDVGGPLAVRALRNKHMVTGMDTWHEHAHRLEWLKAPLQERLTNPWQTLREYEHYGHYTQLYGDEEPLAFDAAILTPNCVINDAPHVRWERFDREMCMIGRSLERGGLVVLHCVSLLGDMMMADAARIIGAASGLKPGEDYCLAWTGMVEGVYQSPESQALFVQGWSAECTDRALEVMDGLVMCVRKLTDVVNVKTEA